MLGLQVELPPAMSPHERAGGAVLPDEEDLVVSTVLTGEDLARAQARGSTW